MCRGGNMYRSRFRSGEVRRSSPSARAAVTAGGPIDGSVPGLGPDCASRGSGADWHEGVRAMACSNFALAIDSECRRGLPSNRLCAHRGLCARSIGEERLGGRCVR